MLANAAYAVACIQEVADHRSCIYEHHARSGLQWGSSLVTCCSSEDMISSMGVMLKSRGRLLFLLITSSDTNVGVAANS